MAVPMPGDRPVGRRHPLNRSFRWNAPKPPFRVISDAQASAYDEVGCFVFEDAFDADELVEILAETDPAEAEMDAYLRREHGGQVFIARADEITFTTHLVARSERLRRLVSDPPLRDIAADLIGPDVRMYWDQAVYKKPGTDASFPWHQDNGYAFVEPQQYLTCWIALTDATLESGCPWVVPGVHRRGTLEHRVTSTGLVCFEDPPDPVPVPVPAGGIAVFSSLTPHCTGGNHTDAVRKAYIVQYAADGAEVVQRDGSGTKRVPVDAPERQFRVVAGGQAVDPPAVDDRRALASWPHDDDPV